MVQDEVFSGSTHIASLFTVRAYEVVFTTVMVIAAIYTYRTRSPLNIGAFIASGFAGGVFFDWFFNTQSYFRVTTDDRLIALWHLGDDEEALFMIPMWAGFFGGPLVLLLQNHETLARWFGEGGVYVFLFVFGAVGNTAFETFNTSVAGIYRYHQREEFLFYGMPYCNMLLAPVMIVMPYWAMRKAQVLAKLLSRTAETKSSQWWIAFWLGYACIVAPWVLAGTFLFGWYVWTEPWTETRRTF